MSRLLCKGFTDFFVCCVLCWEGFGAGLLQGLLEGRVESGLVGMLGITVAHWARTGQTMPPEGAILGRHDAWQCVSSVLSVSFRQKNIAASQRYPPPPATKSN